MTVCDTCRTAQGPFRRTVLTLASNKVQRVIITCRPDLPDVRKACLARRAALDEDGKLMAE